MARKMRRGLVTAEAPATTMPFDVKAWIAEQDARNPGFAAAVEAELAALNREEKLRDLRKLQD